MSSNETRLISTVDQRNNGAVVSYNFPAVSVASTTMYTSSLIVNLQQLQTDLHAQYQQEKNTLTELNRHFRLFIEHVQGLESQNSKYISLLVDLRRQTPHTAGFDDQWSHSYLHLQAELTKMSRSKGDHDLEVELFQMQIGIYRQLIDVEQQRKDDQRVKLEQELKQSSSALNTLRKSYTEAEQEVERLSAARLDLSNKYLRLTHDWHNVKKQGNEWQLSTQSLKACIQFYKNLRSSSGRHVSTSVVTSLDTKDFWAVELERSVKKIRRDFEVLYGTIHREMNVYYQKKMEEVQVEIEQSQRYTQVDYHEVTVTQQTLQVEYEKVQVTYSYEKETFVKLEGTYSKLESDYQSIQIQNEDRYELQSKDMYATQENILAMAYDIEEMRRSKIHLEAEIIVYRHLLGIDEIREERHIETTRPHPQPQPQPRPITSEVIGKYVVNSKIKGAIGIKECAPNGAFIALINQSTNKRVDISGWLLVRRIDSGREYRYTIPDNVRVDIGEELRIYASRGAGGAVSPTNQRGVSTVSRQELVNRELTSWGTGNRIETLLFDQKGDEKASYSQSVATDRTNFL